MRLKTLVFLSVLILTGCQSQQKGGLSVKTSELLIYEDASVSNYIIINIDDSVPNDALFVANFETPRGRRIYEHTLSQADRTNGVVYFISDPMKNWDKWYYKIVVDVYSDTSKTKKIDTLKKTTYCDAAFRNGVKKAQIKQEPQQPMQKISFSFDDRQWVESYPQDSNLPNIVEYILKDESAENLSEMVTTQFIPDSDKNIMPMELAKIVKIEFEKQQCQGFQWSLTRSEIDNVIYQWQYDSCGQWAGQYEIAHLIRGKDGIYRLAYTCKTDSVTEDKKTKWIRLINEAFLTDK
ncbi:MAG: hypothetical protein JW806_01375 [Sedimentisphaerales bacterium]|nr:hypothetical protein [Sedimentisphaerales bacterium]